MQSSGNSLNRQVVLGLLFAVTVESVLHDFTGDLGYYTSFGALWSRVHWLVTSDADTRSALAKTAVFLLTLVRFYLGAWRYNEEIAGLKPMARSFAFVSMTLLFLGFYLTSKFIWGGLFYPAVVLFHVIDLIWFLSTHPIRGLPEAFRNVAYIWIAFDVLTIMLIYIPWLGDVRSDGYYFWVLAAIGMVDLVWLWPFYTRSPTWERTIVWVRGPTPSRIIKP